MCPSTPARRGYRAVAILALLVSVLPACGRPPALADTQASPEALMREVLQAVERRDRSRLEALAISEAEFRDHVWEYLPASRPERNLPMSYVWGDLHQKSVGHLSRVLGESGGRHWELVSVRFEGQPRSYGPFVIHGAPKVRARTPGGEEQELTVCGSLLEQGGRWKVFSFVVDD